MDLYLTVANFAPHDSPIDGHTHIVHPYYHSIDLEWAKIGPTDLRWVCHDIPSKGNLNRSITWVIINDLLVGRKRVSEGKLVSLFLLPIQNKQI